MSPAPAQVRTDAINSEAANESANAAIHRRAVEAAIWGMPIVSVEAMREAFFRDAGAQYNDIVYWSKVSDWKNQLTTPNASNFYVYFNYNTKNGPVVLDLPAAKDAGLFGTITDAWQVPLVDVGPEGEDKGQGGKYLLLPPDFKGEPPAGYIVVRPATYNGYALFRAIPATRSDTDVAKAMALVKQQRLYPLAQASNPPEQRFIDMAGKLLDGIVRYDHTFYARLAHILDEETVQPRDVMMMGQLRTLGIARGKAFQPDAAMQTVLDAAVKEAHAGFIRALLDGAEPWWPDSHWTLQDTIPTATKTGFSFVTPDDFDIDARAGVYFLAFAAPAKLGAASFYLVAWRDASNVLLDGGKTYRLHIPADVPAKQFWAVTVYDLETAGFIRESPRINRDSYDQRMKRNTDGSVDIYFAPAPPADHQHNWIATRPNGRWFAMFRFYGPDKPLFEKTWRPGDIEEVVPA